MGNVVTSFGSDGRWSLQVFNDGVNIMDKLARKKVRRKRV